MSIGGQGDKDEQHEAEKEQILGEGWGTHAFQECLRFRTELSDCVVLDFLGEMRRALVVALVKGVLRLQ